MDTKKNKFYSETEDEFYKCCAKFCEELGITNKDMAEALAPVVGRTSKALELKIGNERRFFKLNNEKKKTDTKTKKTFTKPASPKKVSIQETNEKPYTEEIVYYSRADVGKTVKVKVKDVKPYGAFCVGEDGKVGLIVKSMISNDFVEEVSDYLQVGDAFYALLMPDKEYPDKVLLNAKAIGSIVAINKRK